MCNPRCLVDIRAPREGGRFLSAVARRRRWRPRALSSPSPCSILIAMKLRWALLVACCGLALSVQAAVYRWTDADSMVHYSDQPRPGAKVVDLPELSHYAPPSLGDAAQTADPAQPQPGPAGHSAPYRGFSIAHPTDGETLHNATGDIDVRMVLDPELRKGDQIQLVLDGLGARQTLASLKAELKHVERGPHTLQAEVLDAKGATLIRAAPVRFYLLMPSAAEPSAGKAPEDNSGALSPQYPQIPGGKEAFPSEPGGDKPPAYAPSYPKVPPGGETYPSPPIDSKQTYPPISAQPGGAFSPSGANGRSVYRPNYQQSK